MTARPRRAAGALAVLLCLAAAACDIGTEPAFSQDGFSVLAMHGRLALRNDGERTIHYTVLERRTAAVADLAPPEYWPTLGPGEATSIPYDEIMGYHADATEVLVYWTVELEFRAPIVVRLR